jgi:hypothetical protein
MESEAYEVSKIESTDTIGAAGTRNLFELRSRIRFVC